jgi:hypothetical protein
MVVTEPNWKKPLPSVWVVVLTACQLPVIAKDVTWVVSEPVGLEHETNNKTPKKSMPVIPLMILCAIVFSSLEN